MLSRVCHHITNAHSLQRLQHATYYAPITQKSNLLLMGPPGSGKTSIGKLLGKSLNMSVYDYDDDHLERVVWNASVSQKLQEFGDERFISEEAKAAFRITPETHSNTIISLTGSNPLDADAMAHLRTHGICIYLDCDHSEILARCDKMKVNRVVGQSSESLAQILKKRKEIYENCYDIRVVVEEGESLESICDKIAHILRQEVGCNREQAFVSTRGDLSKKELSEAISNGLSDDGGLYVPYKMVESLHKFSAGELKRICSHDEYYQVALRVMETFALDQNCKPDRLKQFVREAYAPELFSNEPDVVPLKKLDDSLYLLELFHGKTASFKDMALNVFPKLFMNAMRNDNERLFVVATSGDTGSSVLNGFDAQNRDIPIVIMYPQNGVSKIQQMQMEKFERDNPNNVMVLQIKNSDFDFCQHVVKTLFDDPSFKQGLAHDYTHKYQLSSANSINWARFWPQIPFYFWASKQLESTTVFDVCIPTGNFGHILGAILAKRMGVPIRKLIVATNSNCVLHDFIDTSNTQRVFSNQHRSLQKTSSPSIDILLPSNLERYLYLTSAEDAPLIKQLMTQYRDTKQFELDRGVMDCMHGELLCGKASDQECADMIRHVYETYNVKIDPHTAVAMKVAQSFREQDSAENVPMVVASTAHYAKFPEAVLKALSCGDAKYDVDNMPLGELFTVLDQEFPSSNGIHPDIKQLVSQHTQQASVKHDDGCQASVENVVDRIKSFLSKRDKGKNVHAR